MNAPMNQSPFPVQRSLLSAAALDERVLPGYDLAGYDVAGLPTCHFWRRSINDLYLVQAGETRLVLRISPTGWRTYENLAAELELLDFLHQNRIVVPRPLRQKDGEYIVSLTAPEGRRYAVLFTFVPGTPHRPSATDSHCYGRAIAHLHAVTDSYPADRPGFRFEAAGMVDEPLARLRPLFAGHENDFDYLLEIAADLRQAAGKLPRRAPEYGLCHGDVNDNNLLLDGDRWALLDFEYFGYGWRVFDLATFVDNQTYQLGRTAQAGRVLDAFLDGYQSLRPLSQAELDVLPSFVMLRQLWILGTGARCYPNVGSSLFEHWVFERVMPLIREWMADPWKPSGHTARAGVEL
jgi:Ser/Thr protein kinase RdoA (MazF antagonist)